MHGENSHIIVFYFYHSLGIAPLYQIIFINLPIRCLPDIKTIILYCLVRGHIIIVKYDNRTFINLVHFFFLEFEGNGTYRRQDRTVGQLRHLIYKNMIRGSYHGSFSVSQRHITHNILFSKSFYRILIFIQ